MFWQVRGPNRTHGLPSCATSSATSSPPSPKPLLHLACLGTHWLGMGVTEENRLNAGEVPALRIARWSHPIGENPDAVFALRYPGPRLPE